MPQIRTGKLKALAVYIADRVEELPGVPAIAGFDRRTLPFWYGLAVPAGTPREAVLRLQGESVKALKDPKLADTLKTARIFVIGSTPEEFATMMREDHAAWGRVIRETGVRGE